MVDTTRQRWRFREAIGKLIREKSRRAGAVVYRREVEKVGTRLGMTEAEACLEFLGLRGSLWELLGGDAFENRIQSGEDPTDLHRNWFAYTSVVLLVGPEEEPNPLNNLGG